ncbi:MAG: TonB-dependent receptor [Candidatus Omnitrophica bacterium]|nr:TonB-dependent receptor [Candidatus Omnitrophota bacterium]
MTLSAPEVRAEDRGIELGEIVVTPHKIPQEAGQSTRCIQIIGEEFIKEAPVDSVEDLLRSCQSVDVRRRGTFGVQSDISIRGSTFEQVLILINGVKVNDAQTGHHNMDLPVSLSDIERIEVISGPASSAYGANAFSGAVNIITKKPDKEQVILDVSIGEHSLSKQSISASCSLGGFSNRLSLERKESSGWRPDTDFEITTLSFESTGANENGSLELFAGYAEKDFGASTFYSNLYPHEEEHTRTTFLTLKAKKENDYFLINPALYYRRHRDKFILDRNRPWWYTNIHTTYSYGLDLPLNFHSEWMDLLIGSEISRSKIRSSRLGNHTRKQAGVYTQLKPNFGERVICDLNVRADYYEDWDWEVSPSVGIGYHLTPSFKLKSSISRGFRIPTFTELYYDSPANVGNENLGCEKAVSYEAGFDIKRDNFTAGAAVFRREADDLIDWSRNSESEPWRVRNVSSVDTQGLELRGSLIRGWSNEFFGIPSVSLGYTYLNSDCEYEGVNFIKYSSDYLRHQFLLETVLEMPFNLRQVIRLNYEERVNQRCCFLLDTRISKKIEKDKFETEIYLSGSNLLNTSYNETGAVPMPGRWLEAGVKVTF